MVQLEAHFTDAGEQPETVDYELQRLTAALEVITTERMRLDAQERIDVQQRRDEAKLEEEKKRQEGQELKSPIALTTSASGRESSTDKAVRQRLNGKQRADGEASDAETGWIQQAEAAPMAVELAQSRSQLRRVAVEGQKRLREQEARIRREKVILEKRKEGEQQSIRPESEDNTHNQTRAITPLIWPTKQEYQNAKAKIQYSTSHFSFAVAGVAGSGKSSLINMFLDLPDGHPNAAKTGCVETTSEIQRFPDPGEDSPRKWTVWYDIPGAGTLNIPGCKYFNTQCLFVFDLIIVMIGDRMTEVDLEILKNSNRFHIPTFIVRSKSDQHLRNIRKSNGYESGEETPEDRCQQFRSSYITKTRQSIADQLKQAGLPEQRIYLVSCSRAFRAEYSAFTSRSDTTTTTTSGNAHFIDEQALIHDLTNAAIARRCDINPTPEPESQPRVVGGLTRPPNEVCLADYDPDPSDRGNF